MDVVERRTAYPLPLEVPLDQIRTPPPKYWSSYSLIFFASFDENWDCWSFSVEGRQVLMSARPTAPLSPMFIRWRDPTSHYGSAEYLAEIEDSIKIVTLSVCAFDRTYPYWPFGAVEMGSIDEAGWEMLQSFIEDTQVLSAQSAHNVVLKLREETDWLLDPGWQRSEAAPTLVQTKVVQVCQDFPGLDPGSVFKWMCLFLD